MSDRTDRGLASLEDLASLIALAAELSTGLRARAVQRYDLFKENVRRARAKILQLGGSPRDADQLGHLIAGWACLTGDAPLSEDEIGRLDRFVPYIITIHDADNGADDASRCWNTLLGLPCDSWRGGEQLTIGQVIARARESNKESYLDSLPRHGLRFQKLKNETWAEAWLAVANSHPGLDKLFADYPQYRGQRRSQILSDLRRVVGGVVYKAMAADAPLRFAGTQSRAWLIPPHLLPSLADEDQIDAGTPERISD